MISHFKSLTLEEIAERLKERKKTLIIFHARPDADAVGSAFALRELLRVMDVPVYCACADELPDRLYFLTDGTQGSVKLDSDLIIDYERIISVDSASPSQLGDIFTKLRKDVDIMIDHHAKGSIYADNYIDPVAAATGEIIYELAEILLKNGYITQIPERTLNCVYAAISADTGGFRYTNTTPKTMCIAADLIGSGIDFAKINSLLYDSKPLVQLRAEAEAIERIELYFDGRVSAVIFPYSAKDKLGAEDEHLETLIDVARAVEGAEVAFVIKQSTEESPYRVSMRSMGEVDVSAICSHFGGGGHKRASGCTVNGDSAREVCERILKELSKVL